MFQGVDPAKAAAMIADALALAARVAPCITSSDFAFPDAAKALIRGAVLRWNEAGTGAVQSQTTGPYGVTIDTKQPRRSMFWPSEISDLRDMCSASGPDAAFSVEPGVQTFTAGHASVCPAVTGGACLCGALSSYNLGIPTTEYGCDNYGWRA